MPTQYTDFHGIDNVLSSTYDGFDGSQTVRFYALESNSQYAGTGHIHQTVAVYGYGCNRSTGTIDDVTCYRSLVNNEQAGVVTLARNFHVEAPLNPSGTITQFMGLYIDALRGTAPSQYTIYSAGGAMWHAGDVGLGPLNTGPYDAQLDIRGNGRPAIAIANGAGQVSDCVSIANGPGNKVLRIIPQGVHADPQLNIDWYLADVVNPDALVALRPNNGNSIPLYIEAIPSQAAGVLTEWANGSGVSLLQIDLNGNLVPGTAGIKIGTAATQQLGFYNAAPIVQPVAAAAVLGYTAGTSTAVTIDGKFTGNVGTTAYTLADVVAALKNLGLVAA